jgi:hypothetical protein
MRMMALRGVWTTNLAAFLLGVGMYASIALVPALVELPRATRVGFGGSVTAAGLFMLPTAAPQLLVGPLTGHIAMNTVIRTLGGAFGAAIATECLARGGSLDGDFTLAFALCAGALTLGLAAVLAIPGKGPHIDLKIRRVTAEA